MKVLEEQEHVCPVCHGSGSRAIRGGFQECKACDGKGVVKLKVDSSRPWSERK